MLTLLAMGYFFPGCYGGGGGQILHTTLGSQYGPVLQFDLFWNDSPNLTLKKAHNPKDEVYSSKTDEMVKDWQIGAKTWNDIFPKIERVALCTNATYRRQSVSHFAQSGPILTKMVSMASQLQMAKSQEAPMSQIPLNCRNYGISEPWAESPPLWLIRLKVAMSSISFNNLLYFWLESCFV